MQINFATIGGTITAISKREGGGLFIKFTNSLNEKISSAFTILFASAEAVDAEIGDEVLVVNATLYSLNGEIRLKATQKEQIRINHKSNLGQVDAKEKFL